jgi:transcription elongation factor Elf1
MDVRKLEAFTRCPHCGTGSSIAWLDKDGTIRCLACKAPLPGAKMKA